MILLLYMFMDENVIYVWMPFYTAFQLINII